VHQVFGISGSTAVLNASETTCTSDASVRALTLLRAATERFGEMILLIPTDCAIAIGHAGAASSLRMLRNHMCPGS
jgi:hypothetical protein